MRLINPLIILRILSNIMVLETIAFLLCLPVVLIYDEPLLPFIASSVATGLLFIVLRVITRKADYSQMSNRDGFMAVTLSWLLFSAMGTLPYLISNSVPSFTDAFFESASGFTTTGASILSDIEALPYSVLFWRSLTHWIGGIGIIVLVIIVLPSLKMSAQQLLVLESSLKEKIHPRTKAIGFRLLMIYLGLTILEIIFLSMGDMNLFDSVCHTFGTVATGGFSTKNTSIAGFSSYTQYVIALFMLLAGVSYVVYYHIIKLQFSKVRRNEELWFYLGVILVMGVITTLILIVQSNKPVEPAFRHSFFQVISIITTTGFITSDYLQWPATGIILVFILLFAGASTGSSTGSIKMARHLLIIKNISNTFKKLTHSSAVTQVKLNGKPVSDETSNSVLSFMVLYFFIFLIGTILIVLTGLDPVTAASGAATSLGNIGPGLGSIGPVYNYSHLPQITKLIFSLLMIIGRLEIITVIALFSKSFWRL
ncbi:MAG: TrkH family potassium uptake protein [Bacteroidota bacterium]